MFSEFRFNRVPFACLLAFNAFAQADDTLPVPAFGAASDTSKPLDRSTNNQLPTVVVKSVKPSSDTLASSASTLGMDLSVREVPQSITVLTRAQMDDFGLRNLNDLLSKTGSVNVERVETDRTYYTARGFEVSNFQFDGIGMPLTNGSQWGDMDTAIYEQIEVLRGANGLLSPTGNPSATINFVRKRPTAKLQAKMGVTLGSWRERRLDFDASGALNATGSARAGLVVVNEHKDSYLDRYRTDKALVNGHLELDIAPHTQLSLGHVEQRNKAHSPMWGALPLTYTDGAATHYDVSTSTATDWAFWNNTERRSHAELTHDVGEGWRLKTSLAVNRLDSNSELFYVYGTPDPVSGLGLSAYPSAFNGHYTQTVGDVRAHGPIQLGALQHQLLVGISWGRQTTNERSDTGQGVGDPVPDLASWNGQAPRPTFDAGVDGSDFNLYRRSAYAAAQLLLNPQLKLLLGGSATHVSSEGTSYGLGHTYAQRAVSPYLGAVYDLTERVSLYGSLARIFNPQTEVDEQHQVLAPIQGHSLEAGIKSQWLNPALFTSLALFRTKQNNTAQAAGTFADFKTFYRGVNATSSGFELEASGRLARGLTLHTNYTLLSLKDELGQDVRTFVPRRSLRIASTYVLPTLPKWKLGANLKWQSLVQASDSDALIQQDAYALLDLVAHYELGPRLSLSLNLNNATNQRYLTSLYWKQAYYGAPRSFSATLRADF